MARLVGAPPLWIDGKDPVAANPIIAFERLNGTMLRGIGGLHELWLQVWLAPRRAVLIFAIAGYQGVGSPVGYTRAGLAHQAAFIAERSKSVPRRPATLALSVISRPMVLNRGLGPTQPISRQFMPWELPDREAESYRAIRNLGDRCSVAGGFKYEST